MKSIFVTGDKHGEISGFATRHYANFKDELKNSNKSENFVIVCGDFGFIWQQKEDAVENNDLEILNNKPWTTLFVDGNHENFARLNSEFGVVDFHGGKAHKIRDNIYHLMRGEIYDIIGNKFFSFGGARSHDIDDGILDYADKDWKAKYLENINYSTKFKKWYSGHIHLEHEFDEKHRSLYDDWERIVLKD